MAGVSLRVKGQPALRIVTVPLEVTTGTHTVIYLTEGCRIIKHKKTISDGKLWVTFWVDVSGERPFDGADVVFPSGWDFRSMLSEA